MTGSKVAIWWACAVILNYCWLSHEAMIIYAILIWVDFATWVMASFYVNEDVTSKRSVKWLVKKLSLLMIPFVMALFFKWTGYDAQVILTTTLAILIASEAYSVLGNLYSIQTGERVKESDAIKWLLKRLLNITQPKKQ
jgi:hypothetical protein